MDSQEHTKISKNVYSSCDDLLIMFVMATETSSTCRGEPSAFRTFTENGLSFLLTLQDDNVGFSFYKAETTKMANYLGTKLVGVAYKLRKKMKNSPLSVHVLRKTLNVVISRCCFAEDGKEMYQNVKRMYRMIVFSH